MSRDTHTHTYICLFLNFYFIDLFMFFVSTIHWGGREWEEGGGDRRKWYNFQMLKKKNCQPQSLYPVKLFFRNEREIRTYSNKRKLKEFVTRKPTLKEWLNKFSKEKGNDNRKRLKW